MAFCTGCGAALSGESFCTACGRPAVDLAATTDSADLTLPRSAGVGEATVIRAPQATPLPDLPMLPPQVPDIPQKRRTSPAVWIVLTLALAVITGVGVYFFVKSQTKTDSQPAATPTKAPFTGAPTVQPLATSSPTPSPTPTIEPTPTPTPTAAHQTSGSRATTKYFTVDVLKTTTIANGNVAAEVQVCVSALPPFAESDGYVTVSNHAWFFVFSSGARQVAETADSSLSPGYTKTNLGVGDCNKGWVSMPVANDAEPLAVEYKNSVVGDSGATWNWQTLGLQ